MQVPADVYPGPKFSQNDDQRLLLKFDKKAKYVDLIGNIRRKKQLCVPTSDLCLFRVTYDTRNKMYCFNYVSPNDYATDLFGGNLKSTKTSIFYLCSRSEPEKPILTRYTADERKALHHRNQKLIDFVKRRDLDAAYISTYKKRMEEVWKFVTNEKNRVEEDNMGSINNVDFSSNKLELSDIQDETEKINQDADIEMIGETL